MRNAFEPLRDHFKTCKYEYEVRLIDDGHAVEATITITAPSVKVRGEIVDGYFTRDHEPLPVSVPPDDLALAKHLVAEYQAEWRAGGPSSPLPAIELAVTADGLTLTADYGGASGKVSASYPTPAALHAALVEVRADAAKAAA